MASVFLCRSHDSKKQGARVPGGLSEWQLAPAVNEAVRDQVWLAGHRGCMLGKGTLDSRVKAINAICKDQEPKLVLPPYFAVEVHFNWSDSPARSGFFAMAHKFSKLGQDMARSVSDSMASVLGQDKNKGVNKVDYFRQWIGTDWIYEARRQYFVCKTVCPAILVECCFLSNRDEAAWISKRENRSRLGKAIGLGIADFLKGVREIDN